MSRTMEKLLSAAKMKMKISAEDVEVPKSQKIDEQLKRKKEDKDKDKVEGKDLRKALKLSWLSTR